MTVSMVPALTTVAFAGQITAFATNLDGNIAPDLTKLTVRISRNLVGIGLVSQVIPADKVGFAEVIHPVTKTAVHQVTIPLDDTGVNPALINCTVVIQSSLRKAVTLENLNIRGNHQVDIIMPKEEVAFVPPYLVPMCPPYAARTRTHRLGSLFHKR